jgi:hypothetical protein
MQDLMNRVHCDWNELNDTQEVEIIKKFSTIARFLTIFSTRKQYFKLFLDTMKLINRFDNSNLV